MGICHFDKRAKVALYLDLLRLQADRLPMIDQPVETVNVHLKHVRAFAKVKLQDTRKRETRIRQKESKEKSRIQESRKGMTNEEKLRLTFYSNFYRRADAPF